MEVLLFGKVGNPAAIINVGYRFWEFTGRVSRGKCKEESTGILGALRS